jgi:chemotaxis protein methyltransferase CheR
MMRLARNDFERLSRFIYTELGIKLPDGKTTMLEGRLSKRLRHLGFDGYGEYCDYLFSPDGREDEMVHLINAVTTNKTDFFREPTHFSYLTQMALPEIFRQGTAERGKLNIWSAGCSSGEEPYTLAMVLSEFCLHHPQLRITPQILATDISSRVLDMARRGVYHLDRIAPVPLPLRRKYLLKSKDKNNPVVRIAPPQRNMVRFGRLNFMDDDFCFNERQDVIFCRNVIIYFDRPTQEQLVNKFCRQLAPGGYLFLGHSESLHGCDVPLTQVAPTVYRMLGK